jgi:glycosyltransferase involved in cell wall biosynthesis
MFIYIQPMYSKTEVNADSTYVIYSAFVRAMRIVRPDWHFVVAFPDEKSGYRYKDDGFFRLSNVSRMPQRISPRKQANAISYDGGWYDALMRQYAFDVVWCNLVEISGHLKLAGETCFEPVGRPLVFAAHNYMIHDSLPYPMEGMETTAFAQIMGATLADWNVFNSDHTKLMFRETAARWLKSSAIDDIMARSTKIYLGTLESTIQPFDAHNDVPVIAYNHRLQGYKNYQVTFDMLDGLYAEGLRFRVKYMNNTAEKVSNVSSRPYVDVKLCEDRASYLAELKQCDLNITNSQYETFCVAAVESMAFGQPLIAPDGTTFPEITGRSETKYPYLFKSVPEQAAIVRRLVKDRSERLKWGAVLSAFVRREFHSALWARKYAELFETHDVRVGDMKPDTEQYVRSVLASANGEDIHALHIRIKQERSQKAAIGRSALSNQSLTKTKLLRLIRKLGGTVLMQSGRQRVYAPGITPHNNAPVPTPTNGKPKSSQSRKSIKK